MADLSYLRSGRSGSRRVAARPGRRPGAGGLAAFAVLAILTQPVRAAGETAAAAQADLSGATPLPGRGASGLALPRYVSLKSDRVNLRSGPGTDYPTSWVYRREIGRAHV